MASSDKPVTGSPDSLLARRAIAEIHEAVRRTLAPLPGGCVLAVSGGTDSMVLLHAAAAVFPLDRIVVATFDHATGPASAEAVRIVRERCDALDVQCVIGKGTPANGAAAEHSEAEWRRARWSFLDGVAKRFRAPVATAHTRDDQVETIFMRILRDAGPRGLSALYAPSPVLRPLLDISRATIDRYHGMCKTTFVIDPSNVDRRHLRNRVRLDLLPALRAVAPTFDADLLALARSAADWRARVDRLAATFTMMPDTTGAYTIPRKQFAGLCEESLRTMWPALAARAGVVMDWRGTHRLASFTIEGETGQSIQLSGGIEVRMRRDALVLRRAGTLA
jgi:tRNA(Ile)-lysidine synthase